LTAYYNENDPFAAAWLRLLIAEGHIATGDVDERSIKDVTGADLGGYTQHHFFAGIGGWSVALRLAGWPDDAPVWTGSCPCQPFSAAGKRGGTSDARHLWPDLRRLISECHPPVVFGEQVAGKDGRLWLAGVRADLEELAYAVGASDMCAAGVGAPQIRQRLFWVADAVRGRAGHAPGEGVGAEAATVGRDGSLSRQRLRAGVESAAPGRLGHDDDERLPLPELAPVGGARRRQEGRTAEQPSGACAGPWSRGEFIVCADGKARRVEPGIFPLAYGVPNRVGALRGAGNAIVPQVAAEFIAAYCEAAGPT
jgi:DNA (cytosine-5)-methyltransferase 1